MATVALPVAGGEHNTVVLDSMVKNDLRYLTMESTTAVPAPPPLDTLPGLQTTRPLEPPVMTLTFLPGDDAIGVCDVDGTCS
ncbi:hypothetical protein AGMMS50218_05600 [Actinomycetota bacterium]|nr:hypothetical protein AGMMS50218_05600 [Actinomycetota bacterium]